MTGSRAAIRYAKAILEMAHAAGNAEQVNGDMSQIANTLKENQELCDFIASPTIKAEVKESTLKEVFAGSQNITQGLFRLLHENKRFGILEQVAIQYGIQFDELNGREVAVVTTAFPITPELEAKVLEKAKILSDKKLMLQNIVDPAIIGGFILRVGDKQFNASVANSLTTLKRELSN
ncbi:ATP synthase F1 subunit delta [Flavobacterium salilacus subsp. salilacus]|uniref:ATP synthase F1 subunit delta n=1 Tax=Flavobacterium TaxID=237 RepID=UPI001074DA69|nr:MULTISPECIES: ATP synthase F1 subunit delta [Flavobacterium]KAF2518960.1 ATP synthase F1 subunit delta [Flavobacterium salilacus subsp. salilacus]MBE1614878.1 ATP synthase F1 subunit delta [Flavobacterium sp. SaA2.13]